MKIFVVACVYLCKDWPGCLQCIFGIFHGHNMSTIDTIWCVMFYLLIRFLVIPIHWHSDTNAVKWIFFLQVYIYVLRIDSSSIVDCYCWKLTSGDNKMLIFRSMFITNFTVFGVILDKEFYLVVHLINFYDLSSTCLQNNGDRE